MGKWVHRLFKINITERTAICAHCGPTKMQVKRRNGKIRLRCRNAPDVLQERRVRARKQTKQKRAKKRLVKASGICQRCGFVAEHPSQLDIHHINHVHTDNTPNNLEVLCANCHRLHHHAKEAALQKAA